MSSRGPIGRPVGHPLLDALHELCADPLTVTFPAPLGESQHAALTALGVTIVVDPCCRVVRCPDCAARDRRRAPRANRKG